LNTTKDYYAVLGVLPSIETTALKAVYLALLKKYHPDVYKGNKSDGERITKELNEAFEVLGDPQNRQKYDSLRGQQQNNGGDFQTEADADEATFTDADFRKDWDVVVEYYPKAELNRQELRNIAPSLAFSYQMIILTEKAARSSDQIFQRLKYEYLSRYFGKNFTLHEYVIKLLKSKNKDAALEINHLIRVTGEPTAKEIPELISKINIKYKIDNASNERSKEETKKQKPTKESHEAESSSNETNNTNVKKDPDGLADFFGVIGALLLFAFIAFMLIFIVFYKR